MPWTLLQELSAFQTRQGREPQFIRFARPSDKPIPTFTPVFSEKCPATVGSNASQRGSGNAPQTLGSPNSVPKCYQCPRPKNKPPSSDSSTTPTSRPGVHRQQGEAHRPAGGGAAGTDPPGRHAWPGSSVRLKPSGVEWLGNVPEHWKVGPLKRAFISMDYGISESASGSGAIRLLTMGNLRDGQVIVPYEGGVDLRGPVPSIARR